METAMLITFILGYFFIAFEHTVKINKAASALFTGVMCWVIYIMSQNDSHAVTHLLTEQLGEVAGILFFLLGAMTIVELIDAHDGFQVITERIKTKSTVRLLWILSLTTFFLSAVLDNLTTTIVMISMLRKLLSDKNQRLLFAGMIVLAANAGGAWSPIGDVTTTMLWIGGQITASKIIAGLFIPSIVCLLIPLLVVTPQVKGTFEIPETTNLSAFPTTDFERKFVFGLGLGLLVFVPVFKTVTHLPPFMGVLFGLSILWAATELIHRDKNNEDRDFLSVVYALRKIDTPSILFFLGILTAIGALQATGQLKEIAEWLGRTVGNETVIVMIIGLLSAVVDNVPLVAAAQGMYSLQDYPTDSFFWEFLAYATGTGGSTLIIGSAAGVAAMGLENINFFWYLKRISWLALLGYFAGALVYVVQYSIVH